MARGRSELLLLGGYSGIGAGYPGAFGYLTPDLTGSVYLAPNTSFDFTLADYQKLGAAGASAAWAAEWNTLTANAGLPIVLWPWHDYGPTLWQTDPPNASPNASSRRARASWSLPARVALAAS